MTSYSSIGEPRVLAIGFRDSSVDCDAAALFSADTLKGFDLIIVNAQKLLHLEGKDDIDVYTIEARGKLIDRRTD